MRTMAYYFLSDTGGPSIAGRVLSVFAKDTRDKRTSSCVWKRELGLGRSLSAQRKTGDLCSSLSQRLLPSLSLFLSFLL